VPIRHAVGCFIFGFLLAASFAVAGEPDELLHLTQLKAVEAYYRLNQIGEARRVLNETTPDRRGWTWDLLSARVDRSLHSFTGHRSPVVGIALSDNGNLLATGGADNSITLWNPATRESLATLTGHTRQVTTLAFSSDGSMLLSGSSDKTLRLWNVKDRKEIRNYNSEAVQGIYQAAFSPDAKRIGFVSWERTPGKPLPVQGFAKVLDTGTGRLIRRFDTDGHPASGIDFTPDGEKIITGTWGFHVKRHDIAGGTTDWDYDLSNTGYYTAIQSVDLRRDGKYVVLGGKDCRIRLLDASNGTLVYQIDPWQGHREWVNAVRFSPDGALFASGSDDGLVMVWKTPTGERLFTFRGHTGGVSQVVWHPDGRRIYSTSADGMTKEWNLDRPGDRSFRTIENGPWNAPVSPDGNLIAPVGSDPLFALWDLNSGRQVRILDSIAATSAVFSDDGKHVAAGARSLFCYDVATGKKVFEGRGHTGSIYCVDHNGRLGMYASAGDRSIRLWDALTGANVRTIETPASMYAVTFTPDGKKLIAGAMDGTVLIYSTSDWNLIDSLKSGTTIFNLAVTADGSRFITTGNAGDCFVWDAGTHRQLFALEGHTKWVYGLTVHPGLPVAVTASYDRSVRIWDLERGTNILTMYGYENEPYTASLTKDGKRLVVTQVNGIVHVIDVSPE
jgi:WD40 repeat protein